MNMSDCLSVNSHNSKTTQPNFTEFLCMLPVAVDRSFSNCFVDDIMSSYCGTNEPELGTPLLATAMTNHKLHAGCFFSTPRPACCCSTLAVPSIVLDTLAAGLSLRFHELATADYSPIHTHLYKHTYTKNNLVIKPDSI